MERRHDNQTDTVPAEELAPIVVPSPFSFTALAFFFFGLVLLLLLCVGIVKNWTMLTQSTSLLIQTVIILCVIGLPVTLIGVGIQKGYLSWVSMRRAKLEIIQRELEVEHAKEELENMRHQRQREDEAHQMQLYLAESRLPADERGNRPAIFYRETGQIILPPSGNYVQPVPTHFAPRFEYKDTSTRVSEEHQAQKALAQMKLPTFGQLLASGEIYPGMKDILLCYEMQQDEETGFIASYEPRRDQLENNSTAFLLGASKSGKTTLLSHIAGQEALMNAAFYVIDPHLVHPEKSIARRLSPLSHAFILPPAMTDAEVYTLFQHAKAEAEARLNGRETAISGRPIVFIVDEVLALISRAQRTDNKEMITLYRNLCFFFRDLGTQLAKFEYSGVFASQYATKDSFKLPGGDVDFRDGCQNQVVLRVAPNQAQSMRLLQRDELKEVRTLPPGQGYMGFSTGEIIRMGIGDVEVAALQEAGRMVSAVSMSRSYQNPFGTFPKHQETSERRDTETDFTYGERETGHSQKTPMTEQQGNHRHHTTTKPHERPIEPSSESVSAGFQNGQTSKTFTHEQELLFVRHYNEQPNIKECLKKMGLGTGYYAAAAALVDRLNLREKKQIPKEQIGA